MFHLTACDEEKYDDDQYGDHCLVHKVQVEDGLTTTITYDQEDRIITMTFNRPGLGIGRMEVTYNNDMAFIDYHTNDELIQTAEATLNEQGNMVNVEFNDLQNLIMGNLSFTYDSEGKVIAVVGVDPATGINGSLTIQWSGGNPVRFTSTDGTIDCEYFTGERSSFNLGVGNIALLYEPLMANFAMMFSSDLLKTFDKQSAFGPALHIIYDKDSDDKVREIYYSTTTGEANGKSLVSYECHTPH